MAQVLKILHTCETAMGGVGVYQKNLAGMDSRQVEQIFLMPEPHARIMEGDPRVVTFPLSRRGPGAVFNQIRHLARIVRRERPDVVVFHSTFSLFALLAMRLMGLKRSRPHMLYLAHGWAADQYGIGMKSRLVRSVEGNLCGFADLVINVSQNDLDTANRHRYRGKHILIENAVPDVVAGLPNDRFADAPDRLHLLFVGRFDRQKGLDILLEALSLARQIRPDLMLHVIGSAVRDDQQFLPKEVDLIGWVPRDHIDQWYGSADALVVPSRWEGLPLVIPEAFRNGTPVLASRRSGMDKLFEEGLQGFSYDLEVETLAEKLLSIDRDALRALRPACRELYEKRYSIERLYGDILSAYQVAR